MLEALEKAWLQERLAQYDIDAPDQALTGQPIIVRINKASGAFDTTWQLPALPSGPQAWAFAHWGGRYYQFVTNGDKNQVRRYDPQAKTNTLVQDGIQKVLRGDTDFQQVRAVCIK